MKGWYQMLIDKKGNLFGKINIIDIFILIVIIAVGVFVFKKILSPSITVRQDNIVFQIYVEESPDFAAEAVQVGGNLADDIKGVDLGTIIDVQLDEGYEFVPTANGELVRGYKEGYNSVYLTSEVKGTYSENGVIIAGNKYNIGHSITVRAGQGKLFGVVAGFSKGESNE